MRAILLRMGNFAVAAAAVVALGACSMGSLKFAPLPGNKPRAVASAEAPAPAERRDAGENDGEVTFLAFAAAPSGPIHINGLISKYAGVYDVPESLIHRVVKRESTYNPKARNGPYYGLMQISHATARSMGYRGEPSGLLDPDTNLKYAVKYLRGAWIVGGYSQDAAVRHYSRGYYYDAKRQGLLDKVGLR